METLHLGAGDVQFASRDYLQLLAHACSPPSQGKRGGNTEL